MINFNVLKRWVSILSLAVCLFGSLDSAAQVRYIPVDDFSDLYPCQVLIIGNMDLGVVATNQENNQFSAAKVSFEDTNEEMEFILGRNGGEEYFPWTLASGKKDYDDDYFLSYNNRSDRLYISRNTDTNSNYSIKIESSTDSTLISFWSSFNDESTKFLRFRAVDDVDDRYELVCTDDLKNTFPIKLYRKDVYNLYVANPKPVWREGDKIQIHINEYSSTDLNRYNNTYFFMTFSENYIYKSVQELTHMNGEVEGDLTKYINNEILEIDYPGGNIYLILHVSHENDMARSDCLCYHITQSKGTTSISDGHFSHPDVNNYDFQLNEEVKFTKDSDVKIYYTLDGQDPVIGNVEMPLSRAEVEEEETDGSSDEHAGKTYDLDARPIVYTGTPLKIRYIAVKDGYSPSEVLELNVSGVTSVIASIETDNEAGKAQYFDLSGRQVTSPAFPGVYIRTLGGKTDKVMVR